MHTADDHRELLQHATAEDTRGLMRAYRTALNAAASVRAALRRAGLGPDSATVAATLTDDAQPAVVVTLRQMPAHATERLSQWLGKHTDAGGGGPPARRRTDTDRAA